MRAEADAARHRQSRRPEGARGHAPRAARRVVARALRAALCAWMVVLPAAAQDTPEMLAALQAHLPPVPAEVPARAALAADLAAEIPAFRLEVHRWHADPALRYVTIHGRRIVEGGVVDRELWLRRIDPDGVVLQFRDAFFFQPRP